MGNAQQHLESSCQACANGISFVDCVCTTPNGRALSVIDIMAEETLGVVRQPPQAARVMIPPTQSLPHVSVRRRLDADPGFYQRSPAPLSLSPPPEETTSDAARDAAPAATPARVLVPAPRSYLPGDDVTPLHRPQPPAHWFTGSVVPPLPTAEDKLDRAEAWARLQEREFLGNRPTRAEVEWDEQPPQLDDDEPLKVIEEDVLEQPPRPQPDKPQEPEPVDPATERLRAKRFYSRHAHEHAAIRHR